MNRQRRMSDRSKTMTGNKRTKSNNPDKKASHSTTDSTLNGTRKKAHQTKSIKKAGKGQKKTAGSEGRSLGRAEDGNRSDDYEDVVDDADIIQNAKKKSTKSGPKTKKDIFKVFTLSTTNQILQGHSPTSPAGTLSPRPIKRPTGALLADERWVQLVASELFSAKVNVVPRPAEFDTSRVPTDPRRGRYTDKKGTFGPPFGHLCKWIRKSLIKEIIFKHKLIRPRIDTGRGRRRPNKKDLERWKFKRGRFQEEWRKRRRLRKNKRFGVVGSKKKRLGMQLKPCKTCGDCHFRRVCGGKDMKINLMVRQIHQKAEVIQQYMGEVWRQLENMENMYQKTMLRIHRLQSNRVCLGLLTGNDYPGESHPHQCPCSADQHRQQLAREQREKQAAAEMEKKKALEEQRQADRIRREKMLEARKKKFYGQMVNEMKSGSEPSQILSSKSKLDREPDARKTDLTRLEEARRPTSHPPQSSFVGLKRGSSSSTAAGIPDLVADEEEEEEPKLFRVKEVGRESLLMRHDRRRRSESQIKSHELILMDGQVKGLSSSFVEEGGIIRQDTIVCDMPEVRSPSPAPPTRPPSEHRDSGSEAKSVKKKKPVLQKTEEKPPAAESTGKPASTMKFDEFLNLMEVF